MKTEGLKAVIDGEEIYAEGTSLGGDDGIAVAYSLALLDSDTIKHPKLEVIITVDEEVGMDGARAIDLSMLTGNRMINLDSEEEGIFLTSCAGGARVECLVPLRTGVQQGLEAKVKIGGLLGGHSGGEIHKERGKPMFCWEDCCAGFQGSVRWVLWQCREDLRIMQSPERQRHPCCGGRRQG